MYGNMVWIFWVKHSIEINNIDHSYRIIEPVLSLIAGQDLITVSWVVVCKVWPLGAGRQHSTQTDR